MSESIVVRYLFSDSFKALLTAFLSVTSLSTAIRELVFPFASKIAEPLDSTLLRSPGIGGSGGRQRHLLFRPPGLPYPHRSGQQTRFGMAVHANRLKNRLRVSLGARDIIDDLEGTVYLTLGLAGLPGLSAG